MTEQTYNEQMQLALDKTEDITQETDTITLSTGVVLKRKDIPQGRILAILDQFPDPEIPEVLNPEKGKMEKWAGSQEYIQLKQANDMKRGMAMIDTVIVSGTEVVHIPEGFPAIDDDEWVEELELSHIPVKRDSKIARKFAWIKYVAAKGDDDLVTIMNFATGQLGNGEANVANQLQENFPNN